MSAVEIPSPPATAAATRRTERFDALVIGGGQAGLAVGQQLAARDLDFAILDAAPRVGDAWRQRWDSLRLFTPAAYSGLPGLPFPAPPYHLPDKDEVADYLERYAERFELPVQPDTRVEALRRVGARYVVEAGDRRFEADAVVVATGPFRRPQHRRGVAIDAPGLYFAGLRFQHTLTSALLGGVGADAALVAGEVARRADVREM